MRPCLRSRVAGVALALAVGCRNSSTLPDSSTAPTPQAPTAPLNIAGIVRDTIQRPVSDARILVLDGSAAGRFASSNEEGRFTLFDPTPVMETVALQISKAGYTPLTGRWRNNSDASATLIADPLLNLEGQYSIAFDAASACDQLPPAVRTRTYAATIGRTTSNRWLFAATLSGAEFYPGFDTFWGAVGGDTVRFYVSSWDAFNRWLEDHPIFERLDSNRYVSLMGIATATVVTSPTSIAATFDGSFAYCAAGRESMTPFPPNCGELVDCRSPQHRLTLSRP